MRNPVVTPAGSPPRVRGKPIDSLILAGQGGITPACAGKTREAGRRHGHRRDHPRVCGENLGRRNQKGEHGGSPPRVRGKLVYQLAGHAADGITPACAGKTLRKWRISVVDPSPQPRSPLTSRRADASSGSQRAPCAAPV